jgi:hypothetical protein
MQPKRKIRLWKLLLISALLGICGAFPAYVRVPQQCVLCRAERVEYHVLGMSFSTGLRKDGDFTRWYSSNRPPHAHIWKYSDPDCLVERNYFGLPLTISMMKHHPIIFLDPGDELAFVKRQNEAVLSGFFADAASTNIDFQYRALNTARTNLSAIK